MRIFDIRPITFTNIPGLYLYEDGLTKVEESTLIKEIDSQEWDNKLKRRTQMYGYIHDYFSNKKISAATAEGTKPMPKCIRILAEDLSDELKLKNDFNTVIVNEYIKSQGVTPHIDKIHFEDKIISVSLLEGCSIIFSKDNLVETIWLPRRCILLMSDEARWKWKHTIPLNKTLYHPDGVRKRHDSWRRVSVTYRTLL